MDKRMILGGAAGTTVVSAGGAGVYLSLPGGGMDADSEEGEEFIENGPGRDIVSVHSNLKLNERVAKIKGREKCEEYGWEWREDKCTVPEKITRFAQLEINPIPNKTKMDDCINAGGAWWWGEDWSGCRERNIILRRKFKRSLENWEQVSKEEVAAKIKSGDEGLKEVNSKDFWKIKKYGNSYIAIFLKSKIVSNLNGNWEFPSYYNVYEKNPVTTNSSCELLKDLAGGSEGNSLYLYNENKNTFWDCKRGGFAFVSY